MNGVWTKSLQRDNWAFRKPLLSEMPAQAVTQCGFDTVSFDKLDPNFHLKQAAPIDVAVG